MAAVRIRPHLPLDLPLAEHVPGGRPADRRGRRDRDQAEGYPAGQTVAQALTAADRTSSAKIIASRSGRVGRRPGPGEFGAAGERRRAGVRPATADGEFDQVPPSGTT